MMTDDARAPRISSLASGWSGDVELMVSSFVGCVAGPQILSSFLQRAAGTGNAPYLLCQARENPRGAERQAMETNARGVGQRISERGADGNDGSLAQRLGAEGTIAVMRIGEEDLGAGNVGKGRYTVIAEGRIHHGAGGVDHHLLK